MKSDERKNCQEKHDRNKEKWQEKSFYIKKENSTGSEKIGKALKAALASATVKRG